MRTALALAILCFALFVGCAGNSSVRPSLQGLADTTDACLYMDRVCSEADAFQREFNAMPEEQQQDFIPVLNTYVDHCNSAVPGCRESLK